ncbi:unnamed protein product [Adineta steineri]|uniref:Uncharacterized protein n=1 Tax=Adineta steineri TaxID=433720 RepID=A0A813X6F0_9BILA|nr:unnamed protein product [Adineta steineri]CAF3588056.1 unnamed protein product [Adineta steineri]
MAQATFDHWVDMLADPTYAARCQRKQHFRQRHKPTGKYQVDEDVWARHPDDDVMYIASIISIDQHHCTCRLIFVDSDETLNLPISHLRHVTREDIKLNRHVDYGHSWSVRTSIGAINTYDRYGELQEVNFNHTTEEYDEVLYTAGDTHSINDSIPTESVSDRTNENNEETQALHCFIRHLLKVCDTSSEVHRLLPDLNIQLVEQIRQEMSCNEEIKTSLDESTSNLNEQPVLIQDGEKKVYHNQEIEVICSSQVEDTNSTVQLLQESMDQQRVYHDVYLSPISSTNVQELSVLKDIAVQTDSFISLSMFNVDQTQGSIAMNLSSKPNRY